MQNLLTWSLPNIEEVDINSFPSAENQFVKDSMKTLRQNYPFPEFKVEYQGEKDGKMNFSITRLA